MPDLEQRIMHLSYARIADVFGVELIKLDENTDITTDLVSKLGTSASDKRALNTISEDIYDAANKHIMKRLRSGEINIRTIKDYSEYMFECYREDSKLVELILGKP